MGQNQRAKVAVRLLSGVRSARRWRDELILAVHGSYRARTAALVVMRAGLVQNVPQAARRPRGASSEASEMSDSQPGRTTITSS